MLDGKAIPVSSEVGVTSHNQMHQYSMQLHKRHKVSLHQCVHIRCTGTSGISGSAFQQAYIYKHLNLQLQQSHHRSTIFSPIQHLISVQQSVHPVCDVISCQQQTDSHKERRYTCIFEILGKPHEVKLYVHTMRNLKGIKVILMHTHMDMYSTTVTLKHI